MLYILLYAGLRSGAAAVCGNLPWRLSTPLSGLGDQSRTYVVIMPAMPTISSNTPAGCTWAAV